eukprot:COSAG06_NODE_2401_length_6949_cov_4.782774_1_plen_151_part_00
MGLTLTQSTYAAGWVVGAAMMTTMTTTTVAAAAIDLVAAIETASELHASPPPPLSLSSLPVSLACKSCSIAFLTHIVPLRWTVDDAPPLTLARRARLPPVELPQTAARGGLHSRQKVAPVAWVACRRCSVARISSSSSSRMSRLRLVPSQ